MKLTLTWIDKIKKVILGPDFFLRDVTGLIHVGANTGQERDIYRKHGLRTLWIEPIPKVFETLKKNLEGYHNQMALNYLVTDRDAAEYAFHIASNEGASSSIYEMNMHKDIWPNITYEKTIHLRSITLESLLQKENIPVTGYQSLVIDTQGSELLVLIGAENILQAFEYIKIEVPDFESYKECCQLKDIEEFLKNKGYIESCRRRFAKHSSGGSYYDIVYKKHRGKRV